MGQTTRFVAIEAARRVGEVLEVDFRSSREVWVTQFIRVKVLVMVAQLLVLVSGFFLPQSNRGDAWIQFKYENFRVCFNYGRLGHLTNICPSPPSSL